MKPLNILSLAMACSIYSLQAQITLTQADMVKSGTSMAMATDVLPVSSIAPGASGSGQSWNFSALEAENPDTFNIVNPSSLPKSGEFPNADLGYYLNSDRDSVWGFMINDANGIRIRGLVGVEATTGDTIPVDLNLQLLKFPATLGSKFTTYNTVTDSAFVLGLDPDGPGPAPFVDSIKSRIDQITISDIDASGSLTTPFGTFTSIRQYLIETFRDSASMYANGMWQPITPALSPFIFPIPFDTTYSYRWWSNQGVGFPLVELSMDISSNTVEEAFWVADVPKKGTGIAIQSMSDIVIYPNPVNDYLKITTKGSFSESYTFRLASLSGAEVLATSFAGKSAEIDLNAYPSGVYFYSIQSSEGTISTGKLILE